MDSSTLVTVSGSPRLFDWMSEGERRFRLDLVTFLTSEVGLRTLNLATGAHFDFGTRGEECVTAYLTTYEGERLFLKATRANEVLLAESRFLAAWSRFVRTPRIRDYIPRTNFQEAEFLLMERVEARSADDLYPAGLPREVVSCMARSLAKMHCAAGAGFGRPSIVRDTMIGRCATLREEVWTDMGPRLSALCGPTGPDQCTMSQIEAAIEVLSLDLQQRPPVCTHCDMKGGNLLVSGDGTVTVIDPNCRMTHPGICLSACLIHCYCGDQRGEEVAAWLLDAYQAEAPIAEEVLRACLTLRSLFTLSTWVRKRKAAQVAKLRCFMRRLGIWQ